MNDYDDYDNEPKIGKKKKINTDQSNTNQQQIQQPQEQQQMLPQQYYDQQATISQAERQYLKTINLRNLHNWIKSVLIEKYCKLVKNELKQVLDKQSTDQLLHILEIGCGKGGDLKKWNNQKIKFIIGVDIATESLKEAQSRASKLKDRRFQFSFIQASGSDNKEDFYKNIDKIIKFDIVSLQFCAHYMFDCEKSVKNLLQNITARLLIGSYVIMTIPDACSIIKKLRTTQKQQDNYYHYGNQYFELRSKTLSYNKQQIYGLNYDFFLDDGAVGVFNEKGEKIYVTEFFIELNNFIKIAEDYGLEVLEEDSLNFIEFYKKYRDNNQYNYLFALQKYQFEQDKSMDEQLWDISHCYRTLVFKNVMSKSNYSNYEQEQNKYKSDRDIKNYNFKELIFRD